MNTMKAAVYFQPGKPDVLHYRDVPLPVCGPDDVLVKIEAIALEGGDVINRATAAPGPEGAIPGYSAAGSIVAVGANVKDRHPGQRVTTIALAGSHAEYRVAPAAWSWVIPQGLDVAAAAVIPVSFGTAARALFSRLNLKAGETLLIQGGAGGVGVAAIQLAKARGARVLGNAFRSRGYRATRSAWAGCGAGLPSAGHRRRSKTADGGRRGGQRVGSRGVNA